MPIPSRRLLPILAVALLLGAVAPAASARIAPQKGIAGAKLGMTQAKVLDKLGPPDKTRTRTSPIGGFDYTELKYGKTKVSFAGVLDTSEVNNVTTKDRSERTKRGVGVGSKKRAVKRRVKGVECENEFGVRHCFLGEFLAGETVTDFLLGKKQGRPARVTRVTIGIVID